MLGDKKFSCVTGNAERNQRLLSAARACAAATPRARPALTPVGVAASRWT